MTVAALQNYARRVRELLRANSDTPETGLAPAFQQLLTELLPHLPNPPQLTVVPEYNNPGVGRPDIALIRPGQPARAFVELKAPAIDADPRQWRTEHNRRQYGRLQELANWSTCNFKQFRLYTRNDLVGSAQVVPDDSLLADTGDATADALVAAHDSTRFLELLELLCRADAPMARNAEELAHLLAHSARIVRSSVQERLGDLDPNDTQHPLAMVRNTFREVLYAHPEVGGYESNDFEKLFSSAFAQTLAFGLLLVRENLAGQPDLLQAQQQVDTDAWRHMPEEHPLMRAALRILSQEEVSQEIGIGFDVMRDTVNCFDPGILAIEEDGRDPILYFYEDFLEVFDPAARERYGVFYTPLEVVRYMVGALDRALRDNLNTQGVCDPNVTILDPATGTGTFLLGVAERVRDQVTDQAGRIEAAMALANLAGRAFGLELLVGPYAVAHYRLHHAFRALPPGDNGEEPEPIDLPRLGVYLADTLSNPRAEQVLGELGMHGIPIAEERAEAQRIKAEQPILAILGNPPYRRLDRGENETLVGRWMDDLWDDLKAPVRDAGWGNQLNTFPELSIAFWRWALWKLFEADNAPRRGVVAYITNRKFLTGKPYAGLRKMMRERFDRIEIIDLRGDVRAGVRGDVARDQGVFNIMVGTCITVAIADGTKAGGDLAAVSYHDSWTGERFTRRAKLDWLQARSEAGDAGDWVPVERGLLDDFRPEPFQNGEWVSISEAFQDSSLGIQSKRDRFVYSTDEQVLDRRIDAMVNPDNPPPADTFNPTPARPWVGAVAAMKLWRASHDERPREVSRNPVKLASYRPLDVRPLIAHDSVLDRQRPSLQSMWGKSNNCLYTMPGGAGIGPSVWCHGLIPDYHAFRGSYGGYAFPLYDRRRGDDTANLSLELLASLSEAYGVAIAPETLFDGVLSLLSASSYTLLFAEDLENTFPHIPFPATVDVFNRAAAIGAEIRALETFARAPSSDYMPNGFCTWESRPTSPLVSQDNFAEGRVTLCDNGSGVMTGIPDAVWSFSVSGYRVLPRWLEAREGVALDYAMTGQIRDIAGRIQELVHWFDQAALVLEETLAHTLTREALGLGED